MYAIAQIVPPGARVLNDRGDGSAWMYPLTGVKPVAGHYDELRIGPAATLLAARFNQYLRDPEVRAAVAAARHPLRAARPGLPAQLGEPGSRGCTDLPGQPWLRVVYSNPDVVLYEIEPVTMMKADVLRRGGAAAHVAGSQVALAASNYVLLAIAARHLDPAGFAAVSAYYLLINTVGRGLFAAVELETTRAVAAGAHGHAGRPAAHRRAAGRRARAARARRAAAHRGRGDGRAARRRGGHDGGVLPHPRAARGQQRYGRYAATFWIEAAVGLAAAVVLTVVDEHATAAWIAVLALAPGGRAAAAAGRRLEERHCATGRRVTWTGARAPVRPVLWSAALLLAGQGVWNLAPVLVDRPPRRRRDARRRVHHRRGGRARAGAAVPDDPGDAAPPPRRRRAHAAPLVAAVVAAGLVWVAVATVAVPFVAALVFATTAPPPPWVVAVLALSIALGARGPGRPGPARGRPPHRTPPRWPGSAGLVALLVVGLVAAPPVAAATIGQLAAAGLVLGALVIAGRKP